MTSSGSIRTVLVLGIAFALLSAAVGPAIAADTDVGSGNAADVGPGNAADVGSGIAAGSGTPADAGDTAPANAQAEDCTFPIETTDGTGTTVALDEEPERVVTLAPSAAQTMWEIGAEEKVVGVSQYGSYLEGADSRTNVSGASQAFVDAEKVVALEPDLVLAPDVIPPDTVEKLREQGLTVYHYGSATSLDDVESMVRATGELVGACEAADQRATEMSESLAAVESAVEGEDDPRVLYVMGGGYTAGEGTFIHDIITSAGGTNVAATAGIAGYAEINEEKVLDEDPEWIVTNSDVGTIPDTAGYRETTAVRSGQVFVVNANYVSQSAPRTVRVIERMAATFHPEAYDGATPYETLDVGGEATTEVTDSSTPGMGVPVAMIAVAVVALSLLRRD